MRIDTNALAPEPRPPIERHEAKRLRRRRVDLLPDVKAKPVAHQCDFVHKADVDATERVLQKFDHLGRAGARHRYDAVDRLLVQLPGDAAAHLGYTAEDLGSIACVEARVPRVDTFRRE